MRRKRYMIVDHPVEHDKKAHEGPEEERYVVPLQVHGLLHSYHWSRLDDNSVIVVAEYPVTHHNALMSHPAVTILPSQGSSANVLDHVGKNFKQNHYTAISPHVDQYHTMGDLVDTLEERFGAVFGADK